MKLALSVLLTCSAFAADMDSTRGAKLFQSQGCIQCHSVNGQGGHIAADLGHIADRGYTPASLASTMWNHAPAMWGAIRSAREKPAGLTEQDAGDLFAFFYSARFFEQPGDAARGKRVFVERRCSGCHGIGAAAASKALPPDRWTVSEDPVALVAVMWNHSPQMLAEVLGAKKRWPELTAQDLTDLLVFVRNLPGKHSGEGNLQLVDGNQGESLFHSKGCLTCHGPGKLSLSERLRGLTLTGIAAKMWNHAPKMNVQPIHLEASEMRALLAYLWARPFFEERGNASGGRRVFAAKHCAGCHDDAAGGAPHLPRQTAGFNGITMVSALWRHGPAMLDSMNAKGVAWPRFSSAEMSNLIAYLNSGERK
jgi:mono/diheme cytochrome c family protein